MINSPLSINNSLACPKCGGKCLRQIEIRAWGKQAKKSGLYDRIKRQPETILNSLQWGLFPSESQGGAMILYRCEMCYTTHQLLIHEDQGGQIIGGWAIASTSVITSFGI
jgi:hypothetical protein